MCPKRIDTGASLLASHRVMREKGAMPWAFHEFFLRDMASANGEARLARAPRGHRTSRYVFFPDCQFGASDARYVPASYQSLRRRWPDTALMLACCGAPAEWAGDEPLRGEVHARMREEWIGLGRPRAIFACPTCRQVVRTYLPELEGTFLYELLLEKEQTPLPGVVGLSASVFDPCASRHEPAVQEAVRGLSVRAGLELEPPAGEGRFAECCGWGGQVSVAHPPYARYVAQRRVEAGAAPYVTYCSNCRDIFAAAGKPAWHVLDLVYGLNEADRAAPTITARRFNRAELKRRALEEFWQEANGMETPSNDLLIAPDLQRKLNDGLILESDVRAVIEHWESSGRKVLDPASGTTCGHLRIGNVTFWVEYRRLADGRFELVTAYTHRMSIEEG